MSAKFKAPASTPQWTRAGSRPSDRSHPSPAKKRKTTVLEQAVNLSDDDANDEEEGRDDVPVGNLDLVDDFAMPPHRPSVNVPDSRPSIGTPSTSRIPGASSSMGRREKRKERDPMAFVLESLTTMMAESQRKHDLQMAELSAQ